MLTVFIVMTGDAWVSPMMDGISVLGPHAAVFYIVVVLVGTYLMMNLLVAVLLHLFSQKSDAETASAKGDGSEDKDSSSKSDEDVQIMRADDYALGCYAPDDPFRRQCREWIESPTVDAVMTVTVFASSLALTLDTPRVDPNSGLALMLSLSNYLFTAAFAVEAGAKVVGYGFVGTPNACKQSDTAVPSNALPALLLHVLRDCGLSRRLALIAACRSEEYLERPGLCSAPHLLRSDLVRDFPAACLPSASASAPRAPPFAHSLSERGDDDRHCLPLGRPSRGRQRLWRFACASSRFCDLGDATLLRGLYCMH